MGLFPFHCKGLEKSGVRSLTLFLSASFLLLPIPQGLGLDGARETGTEKVLCITPEGRVALESGLDGRCCPGPREISAGIAGSPSAPPLEKGGLTGGSPCCQCIDLPIAGIQSPPLHATGSRKPAPPGKTCPTGPALILASPDIALPPSRPLEVALRKAQKGSAALLGTVVLLI